VGKGFYELVTVTILQLYSSKESTLVTVYNLMCLVMR